MGEVRGKRYWDLGFGVWDLRRRMNVMPCGRKKRKSKISKHKRRKRMRKDRHKKKRR
jgi:hypothetical protein